MRALDVIRTRIREQGPITVAEFMEIALYQPGVGYYARAAQRSGNRGDFFTSVDVGPLFGELVAVQVEEMARLLDPGGSSPFGMVEAAAGNGRLSKDILDAIAADFPDLYPRVRLSLVETSREARAHQRETLGRHADLLVYSGPALPPEPAGTIVANELLDAMPVHVVRQTANGPREVFVAERDGVLVESLGDLSHAALGDWIAAHHAADVAAGAQFEVPLAAERWMADAAGALERGFLLLFDYGHEADELLSATHAAGTLTSYRSHTADTRRWLDDPGEADITSHVNFTAVRRAATACGLVPAGLVDQTYFLIALGLADHLHGGSDLASIKKRLAARTLIMPGGLGSTMKAMAFATPDVPAALRGFSAGRVS